MVCRTVRPSAVPYANHSRERVIELLRWRNGYANRRSLGKLHRFCEFELTVFDGALHGNSHAAISEASG